jgi:uncharacterized protein YndB with AHSA1/START domain
MENVIRKEIELKAPVARIWKAITDYREFGEWFRVQLNDPFVVGKVTSGYVLHPGYEHVLWQAYVTTMEPERLFAFTWAHVPSLDKAVYTPDYSNAPRTLVEFRLEPTTGGTLLTIKESGFENLPAEWRERNFLGNDAGWTQQVQNIESYVTQTV